MNMIDFMVALPMVSYTAIGMVVVNSALLIVWLIRAAVTQRKQELNVPRAVFEDRDKTSVSLPSFFIPVWMVFLCIISIVKVFTIGEGANGWILISYPVLGVTLAIFVYLLQGRKDLTEDVKWKGDILAISVFLHAGLRFRWIPLLICIIIAVIFMVSLYKNGYKSLVRQIVFPLILELVLVSANTFGHYTEYLIPGNDGHTYALLGSIMVIILNVIVGYNVYYKLANGRSFTWVDKYYIWIGSGLFFFSIIFIVLAIFSDYL